MSLAKVAGDVNSADLGTKILTASRISSLFEMIGVVALEKARDSSTESRIQAVSSSVAQRQNDLIELFRRLIDHTNA